MNLSLGSSWPVRSASKQQAPIDPLATTAHRFEPSSPPLYLALESYPSGSICVSEGQL
jgi:hypothetical protein